MDRPENIYLPTLYAGHPAPISWDAVSGVEGYSLERRINAEDSFRWVGTSGTTSFTDIIPESATTATYRIQAFNTINLTWDDLEDFDRDWDAWDAINWTWFSEYSEFTVSETTDVTLAKPEYINIPTLYAGHPATITWGTVLGTEGYSLERKLSGESNFTWIYSTSGTSYMDEIPLTATTATYRVQAYRTTNQLWDYLDNLNLTWNESDDLGRMWFSAYSEFATSQTIPVARVSISVPTLHAGYIASITWTNIPDATTYTLDRKIDSSGTFIGIYSGSANSFIDTIPETAKSAIYRMRWTRVSYTSNYVTSHSVEVIPNRPPMISGQDESLGTKYKEFSVIFSATDPDPGNTIHLVARLNGTTIFNMPNAQQGVNYTATVTDAQIFSMPQQSSHTIAITATDNKGLVAMRIFTFIVVEDLVTTAVFYVLRDGQPIAKLGNIQQWTDYMEVGTHRYVVRGVDRYSNFSDSNEITVTITLQYATLALVSSPENFISLIARREERPQMGRNCTVNFNETWYEGRTFPVYDYSGQKRNAIPLGFTTTTLQEQKILFSMISRAAPFIYRDQYDMRVVGVIPEFSSDFQGRFPGQEKDAIIDFNITVNQVDFNEVVEYD